MSSLLVGLAAIWYGDRAARRGHAHSERIAAQSFQHQLTLVREQLRQQRTADAYLGLLALMERMGYWARVAAPNVEVGKPTVDEQIALAMPTVAFGSEEVNNLSQRWNATITAIKNAVDAASNGDPLIEDTAVLAKLDRELRPAEKEARVALTARIVVELSGRQIS